MPTSHSVRRVAESLVAAARSEQLGLLAAAIAYYAFVSTVPLVLLGLAAATVVGGDALATAVLASIDGLVTPDAAALIESAITSGAGRGGATVVGLILLGWSGLRIFRGLDVAFSLVYGASESTALGAQLRDSALALGAMGVAVLAIAALVAVVPAADPPVPAIVRPIVTVVALSAVFFPLYYVFPDRPVGLWEATPGAVFAGFGWTALATVFSVYATYAGSYRLYGVLGGVILVLTWFYVGGLLLLLGAQLNAVLAGRSADRQLQQEPRRGVAQLEPMSEGDDATDDSTETVEAVETREVGPAEFAALRREVEDLAADLEEKTRAREDLEADLRRYVRWRQRRGHARGWGPYLVLLYGTAMTVGAFYFLSGGWAIIAMVVVWLSTLGLYTLMVLVGLAGTAIGVPGGLLERLRNLR